MPILRLVHAAHKLGHGHLCNHALLKQEKTLADRVAEIEETYPDIVPRPPHWGGFIIRPHEMEFWADGAYRLHDRFAKAR